MHGFLVILTKTFALQSIFYPVRAAVTFLHCQKK